MKSIIQKVFILVGLVSIVPFFSYAASVSCRADYSNDLVGENVNITATVNDGNGTAYDFTWTGDDGLDATGESISYAFTQEGTMNINVTASSTDSSDLLNGSCSVTIYTDSTLPDFSASCSPSVSTGVIGQDISWVPSIDGPLGPYTVTAWTGTDGLTSSEITYASSSDKFATMVLFESRYGSQTSVHNAKLSNVACDASVYIVPEEIHNPTELTVAGTCAAVDNSVNINDTVVWNSDLTITGGAAPYQITWSDTLGSMGVGTSVSKSYSATGTISAFLSVEDNAGQSTDIQCGSVTVRTASSGGGSSSNTCSYTYSDWGSCVAGSQDRTATGDYTNCSNSPEEALTRTCTVGGSTSTSTATSTTSTATSTATSTSSTSTSTSQTATSTTSSNPVITGGSDVESDDTDVDGTDGEFDNNGTTTRPVFTEDMIPGSYGEAIADLQQRLTEEGFYNGLVGGFFGPATEEALKAYQAANGLPVTGILDAETRAKLNIVNDLATGTSTSATTTSSGLTGLLSAAVGTIGDFGTKNWSVILYVLLVTLAVGLLSWFFMIIKKSDKNK